MITKNPFHILGLNPDILKSLTNEQINSLVISNHRQLARIYHPDVQKDKTEEFREVQEAYEILQPKKNFELYLNHFLKKTPQKQKISDLEDKVQFLSEEISELDIRHQREFVQYFQGLCSPNTVFNMGNTQLKVYDSFTSLNTNYSPLKGKSVKEQVRDAQLISFYLRYKDNVLEKEDYKGKIITLDNTKLLGCIDNKTATKLGGISRLLRNTLGIDVLDPNQMMLGLGKNINVAKNRNLIQNQINVTQFSSLVKYLTPEIEKHSYLFSVSSIAGTPYFKLQGTIGDIE